MPLRDTVAGATGLWDISAENARLREENEQLRRWQSIALALDAENQRLKANLHWIPDPAPSYVTARVVADAGGVYAKAVLLSVGPNHGIRKGEIALDERGLVGRVTEVGARTARVLLITDLNSRIPVILENSRAPRHPGRHQRAAAAADLLAGRRHAAGGRAGRHQRRGRRLPGQPAGRHGAFFRRQRARGGAGGDARSARGGAHLRLRAGRHGGAGRAWAPARAAGTLMARADQTPGIRPRATLGRRLDIAARHAFPAGCTVLLMLLTETPFGIADQAALLPAVTLACVYFWSLFRPGAMPPPVVFLIGLLFDLLGYLPLGVGALTLLIVHGWRCAGARC